MRFPITCLALVSLLAGPAFADNVTFRIKSDHPKKVQIKFYSQQRNHVWPTRTTSYNLFDSDLHDFRLECNRGEKICYGAWVMNTGSSYWGVGYGDKDGCERCCIICSDGATLSQTLSYGSTQSRRPPGGTTKFD